jgi:glycosyltransferase involved in cell wall biosynthesis
MKRIIFSLVVILFAYYIWSRREPQFDAIIMVKNEAKTLPRLLQSLRRKVGRVIVCDTGSNDTTVSLAQDWGAIVFQDVWINFGHNRNLCLRHAQQAPGRAAQWIILADADHEIVFDAQVVPNVGSMLHVQVRSPGLTFRMPYVISSAVLPNCSYLGVTHEYLDCGPLATVVNFDGVVIWHHGDGGSKGDKFDRDLILLKNGLSVEKSPHLRVRYAFYLARTYEDLGQWQNAIDAYKRRIAWQDGSWWQEVFYSKYRIGICLQHLGQTERAKAAYLDAYHYHPHRREPLYRLAHLTRNLGSYTECLLYGRSALQIASDTNALFLEQDIYSWKTADEVALCMWYAGQKEGATSIWNLLLPIVPESERERLVENTKWITK